MLIGYARVSTDDQDLRLQRAALLEADCKRVFEEKISGAKRDRPELARLFDQIRPEDVVVVTRLDRLARSTRDLLDIADKLRSAEAGLRSLHEPWADTTSPAGRMVLTIFAGIAEFERELIHERTGSGRAAAKQRGVRFGRPPKLTPEQIALAQRLVAEGTSAREAAKMLGVHAARCIGRFPNSSIVVPDLSCLTLSSAQTLRCPQLRIRLAMALVLRLGLAGPEVPGHRVPRQPQIPRNRPDALPSRLLPSNPCNRLHTQHP